MARRAKPASRPSSLRLRTRIRSRAAAPASVAATGVATLLAFGLALIPPNAFGADSGFEREPGMVILRDAVGERDEVEVLFPIGTRLEDAEERLRAAAAEAGLRVEEIRDDTEREERADFLDVELETSLATRPGFLKRRIPARLFAAFDVDELDQYGGANFVLESVPGAELITGAGAPLDSSLTRSRFTLEGTSAVAYRIPAWRLGVPVLVLVGLALFPFALTRSYARRLERRSIDKVEKVHKLTRTSMLFGFGTLAVIPVAFLGGLYALPELVLAETVPSFTRSELMTRTGAILAGLLAFLVPSVATTIGIWPVYRRLRGIEPNRREAARKFARALLFFVPMLLWFTTVGLLPDGNPALRLGALLALLVLFTLAVWPLVIVRAADTYELEPALRERLLALCREHGFRVRDVRAIRSRWQKQANAAIVGPTLPFRYILVSDYLIDTLGPDEIEAVVAHEIAHGKRHHLLAKIGASLGALVLLTGALVAFAHVVEIDPLVLAIVTPLMLVAVAIGIQSALSLRQELSADAYAAETVGGEAMIRALDKLASLNMTKRRTGFVWNLLTQHPAIEDRIGALRKRARAASA